MCQTSYLPFSPRPKILHVSNFILTFQSPSKDTTCVKLHTYLSVPVQRYYMWSNFILTFQSLSKDTTHVKLHTCLSVPVQRYYMCQTSYLPFSPHPKILHLSNFILTFQSMTKDTTCRMCQTSYLTFQSMTKDTTCRMCHTSYLTFQSMTKDATCVKLHILPFSSCPKILHNTYPFSPCPKILHASKLHTLPFSPSPHFLGTGRTVIQWLEQLRAVKVHLVCVPERLKGVALLGIAPTRFTAAASSSIAER